MDSFKAIVPAEVPKFERAPLSRDKSSLTQNVGPPADLATSHRSLSLETLRLLRKMPLMPSRAATDGVMRRVDVASPFPNSLL